MRKVTTFLGAALVLGTVMSAGAQQAPDMFKDLDTNHWAYQAVESLRAKNIVWGYPDGWFRGKRTLTRYEFAVALDRALKSIKVTETAGKQGETGAQGPAGAQGAQGEKGEAGPQGPSGVSPEDLDKIKKLAGEFKDELSGLGNNIAAINRKLDGVIKDVADLKDQWNKAPKLYGGAFIGIRSDRANGGYVDYDGRPSGGLGLVNSPVVVHQYVLGVKANLAGGGSVDAALTSNNYKNYLGDLSGIGPVNSNAAADTYIHHLEINTPFTALGQGGKLTIGRTSVALGHLTLMRPDTDRYFSNPFEDTGKYTLDGAKLSTKFGSVTADIVAGQTKSYQGTNGVAINSPLAGSTTATIFGGGVKPFGQAALGQMTVDQLIAVKLGLNTNLLGKETKLSVTALDGSADQPSSVGAGGISNILVLGGSLSTKFSEKVGFDGEWAKSITGVGRFKSVGVSQNNAFTGNFGFGIGGIDIKAGYRYIDPLYYAPGYWGRIGNWLNPTNIQGPTFRANYNFNSTMGMNFGGDFLSAARDRAGSGGLGTDDNINRVLVGVRWDVAKNFKTTLDWEGVYWKLNGSHGGAFSNAGTVHPTEQYLTLGTGYNLTSNTALKLSYQIGDFNGHGVLNGGAGNQFNNNTFTTQVSVKF